MCLDNNASIIIKLPVVASTNTYQSNCSPELLG